MNKEHPKYSEATKSLRALPENYRPALSPDVPEGRACGNCYFYDESNVQGDKAWCKRWDDYVDGAYYCNAWQPKENGRHMTNKIETRRVTINDFDIRDTGDGMSFSGYAAVFDSPSEPLPFLETIRAGAFAKSLKSRNNVMMLWSHDTSQPLASTRSKTMRLYEDTRGLMVEADLPQTSLGRDVSELLRARVVDSMSFGFSVPRNGDVWSADGMTRELVEVRLHEVSVVAFPAYAKTSASVRSLDALADRIGTDASVLSSALDALESGDTLTRDQATLLASVVDTLSPDAEPVQELVTDFDVKVKLAVLKDMIDLTYKSL
jgi:HK97 family phage prohead protease